MLREAEGIRASGRGQAEAPVMLREAKHLWLARTFRLTDGGGAEASNGAGGAG